jgi:hypothetical protein
VKDPFDRNPSVSGVDKANWSIISSEKWSCIMGYLVTGLLRQRNSLICKRLKVTTVSCLETSAN